MASLGMSKLPWYGQLGAFVAIALAGAGAFYYLYEMPQQEILSTAQRELDTVNGRITAGRETARKLPEFKAQIGDLEAKLEGLKPILPEEKDVGDLLRRIQTLATQSSLTIRGFRPQAITAREIHAEWPIGLELDGTYHNLGAFLDRVSKFPRIINVGSLAIAAKQEPTASGTITISCTATTFVLVDQPAAAASTPAQKKGAAAPGAKTE